MRRTKFLICFFVLSFTLLLPGFLLSLPAKGYIDATIDRTKGAISGKVSYRIKSSKDGFIYFHLPPAFHNKIDNRSEYQLRSYKVGKIRVERRKLDRLKDYRRKNPHLPVSIEVLAVESNGEKMSFELVDNPTLSPLKNSINSLLRISSNQMVVDSDGYFEIIIEFKTYFNADDEFHSSVIWDFAPRPVYLANDLLDTSDFKSIPIQYTKNLSIVKEGTNPKHFSEEIIETNISALTGELTESNGLFDLFLDRDLAKEKGFYKRRIEKVLTYLIANRWIKPSAEKYRFAIWDGSLSTSGRLILLPRRLFRYLPVYYKLFEVSIIKGLVESHIKRHFVFNAPENPWLLPALQSEVIRSYFEIEYQNDSKYFPWTSWLNPDYFGENSIKNWIATKKEKHFYSAQDSIYFSLDSIKHHPWYEKGFHLFRTIYPPEIDFETNIHQKIKDLLQGNPEFPKELSGKWLIRDYLFNEQAWNRAEKWLSESGSVDYGVESVVLSSEENRFKLEIEIESFGTLNPPFEVFFFYDDGSSSTELLTNGADTYTVYPQKRPIQIELDPNSHLLEDNLLNNSWDLPLKVRPLWDFSSAKDWVFTAYPMISGNTFDQNLFGIGMDLSYLTNTVLNIDLWKSGSEDDILYESSVLHKGFPWIGSQLYLEVSELNASFSKTAGFLQNNLFGNGDSWIDYYIIDDKPESLDENDISADINYWLSNGLMLGIPIYDGDFSKWKSSWRYVYGENKKDGELSFHQQSMFQSFNFIIGSWDLHFSTQSDYTHGTIPSQKKYPIGGPEGLPGYPRETELLFSQRQKAELGVKLPSFATHTDLNLLQLGWLDRIETSLNTHWGVGEEEKENRKETFQDVEIRFDIHVDWLNLYNASGVFAIAKPINNERYKDYRIVLFSNWVF